MARPARVRMRRRKPCVFARLRLFGWNVRFTGTTPLSRSWWKASRGPVQRRHRSTDGTGLRKQASTRPVGQCGVVTRAQRATGAGTATTSCGLQVNLLSRTGTNFVNRAIPCTSRHCRNRPSPWGQRWGRAVDERGTTRPTTMVRPNLGTTPAAVPSRILTAIGSVSRADRRSSTCPQGLWLLRVSLFLHPFKPIAWGQRKQHGAFVHNSTTSPTEDGCLGYPQLDPTYPQYEEGQRGESRTTTQFRIEP